MAMDICFFNFYIKAINSSIYYYITRGRWLGFSVSYNSGLPHPTPNTQHTHHTPHTTHHTY